MYPNTMDYAGFMLATNLEAVGIPTDNLGQGVVDLMIERRDGERHGEVRLVVAEDGETVNLSTVWYALDDDGGEHPVDDDEHGEFDVFDYEGVAEAIRGITGITGGAA